MTIVCFACLFFTCFLLLFFYLSALMKGIHYMQKYSFYFTSIFKILCICARILENLTGCHTRFVFAVSCKTVRWSVTRTDFRSN